MLSFVHVGDFIHVDGGANFGGARCRRRDGNLDRPKQRLLAESGGGQNEKRDDRQKVDEGAVDGRQWKFSGGGAIHDRLKAAPHHISRSVRLGALDEPHDLQKRMFL